MKNNRILILFWSTWDLAKRYIIPWLYSLYRDDKLWNTKIFCIWRRDFDNKKFVSFLREEWVCKKCKTDNWKNFVEFANQLNYLKIDINSDDYNVLKESIDQNRTPKTETILYLSISPSFFDKVIKNLKKSGIDKKCTRIAFEKPFWNDLKSAQILNNKIRKVFKEEQIYRIDHYLGKESIQNILAFRFANEIFEPIWNNKYIDNIQITAAETLWVGTRWEYYDQYWALRDMLQNHLLQVLALTTMEPPCQLDAQGIKEEKSKLIRSLQLWNDFKKYVVFGQYQWYLDEVWVKKKSKTETYAALKVYINNRRFKWVPIYLRTWKKLKEKQTKVVIEFKKLSNVLYPKNSWLKKNRIIIDVAPHEGIWLQFNIKEIGKHKELKQAKSQFINSQESPQSYEKIMYDLINWDSTLFTHWDIIENSWRLVDELIKCKEKCVILHKYTPWTYWPNVADNLLKIDWREWFN